jgi:hypothetical protein
MVCRCTCLSGCLALPRRDEFNQMPTSPKSHRPAVIEVRCCRARMKKGPRRFSAGEADTTLRARGLTQFSSKDRIFYRLHFMIAQKKESDARAPFTMLPLARRLCFKFVFCGCVGPTGSWHGRRQRPPAVSAAGDGGGWRRGRAGLRLRPMALPHRPGARRDGYA